MPCSEANGLSAGPIDQLRTPPRDHTIRVTIQISECRWSLTMLATLSVPIVRHCQTANRTQQQYNTHQFIHRFTLE